MKRALLVLAMLGLGAIAYAQWQAPQQGCNDKIARCDGTWATNAASAAWGAITGTLSDQADLQSALDAKEGAGTYSGIGTCAANAWASTLNDGSAPTCTQPAFSNLSGAATDAQIPNTITVDLAATATALAANGGNCSGNNFALGVDASGVGECAQPAFSNLSGSATDAQVPNTITLDNLTQVTTRAISDTTGTLAIGRGGTGATSLAGNRCVRVNAGGTALEAAAADCNSGGGSDPWTYLTVNGGSDFTTSSASAVDVTGLSFTPSASTRYEFECSLAIRTATSTVNPRVGFAWATGLTDGVARIEESQAATGTPLFASGNPNAALLVAVGGLPNTTQSWPVRVWATVVAGSSPSGSVRIQLASETAGTNVTIRTVGSECRHRVY